MVVVSDSTRKTVHFLAPSSKKRSLNCRESLSDFQASFGWLAMFRSRHNINFTEVCDERRGINNKGADDLKAILPEILQGYDDMDMFNMDESALFFLALSDKSLSQSMVKNVLVTNVIWNTMINSI